ncbi:hypothetical protein FA95DRAFT_446264 [Auriscalpium vulgare]|uniref:Uncharacterized protein n=1 Tax=Auriscalpium vulgare TaxID=40419 RepID=A0ACB8RHN4_9AGAM|nr:hypothetical protein FA95DRAFT_446264 [Auriscalpium vulgare]
MQSDASRVKWRIWPCETQELVLATGAWQTRIYRTHQMDRTESRRQFRGNVEDARQAELGKGSVFVQLSAALKRVHGGIGFVSRLLDEAAAAFEQKRPPSLFLLSPLDAPLGEILRNDPRSSIRPSVRIRPCCPSVCHACLLFRWQASRRRPNPQDLCCTLPGISPSPVPFSFPSEPSSRVHNAIFINLCLFIINYCSTDYLVSRCVARSSLSSPSTFMYLTLVVYLCCS